MQSYSVSLPEMIETFRASAVVDETYRFVVDVEADAALVVLAINLNDSTDELVYRDGAGVDSLEEVATESTESLERGISFLRAVNASLDKHTLLPEPSAKVRSDINEALSTLIQIHPDNLNPSEAE